VFLSRSQSPKRRLLYFDLARYALRILLIGPLVMPTLGRVQELVLNPRNLGLTPPGLATLSQWLVWLLGVPLSEFAQVDGSLPADIYAVARGSSSGIYGALLAGMLFVLVLDFLWAYRNNLAAGKVRTGYYVLALASFIIWTLIACTVNLNIPGAGDLYHRWMFMQYWHSYPWMIILIVWEIVFSFWLPLAAIGYLIYSQHQRTAESAKVH